MLWPYEESYVYARIFFTQRRQITSLLKNTETSSIHRTSILIIYLNYGYIVLGVS